MQGQIHSKRVIHPVIWTNPNHIGRSTARVYSHSWTKKTGHWRWASRFTRFMSSWTKYDARCGNASNARMSRWKMAISPAGFCMSDLPRLWNTGHIGMSKVIWKKGACWQMVHGDGVLEASTSKKWQLCERTLTSCMYGAPDLVTATFEQHQNWLWIYLFLNLGF